MKCLGVDGFELDRFIVARYRSLVLPQLAQDVSAVNVSLGVVTLQCNSLPITNKRFIEAT